MKVLFFAILSLLLFSSTSHALDCEKAFLNPTVYRMCKTEETLIAQDTERLEAAKVKFEKAILDDAAKQGKKQALEQALANINKSPTEEFLINSFIYKNKNLLEDIKYQEWKLTASKDEMETIMDNFYSKALAKK